MADATPSAIKKVRLEALDRRQSAGSPAAFSTPKTPSYSLKKCSQTPTSGRNSQRKRPFPTPISSSENDATYAPLCESILSGELADDLQLVKTSDGKQAVRDILKDLWLKNTKALKDFDSTVVKATSHVVLLDNPTTHQMFSEKARARAQQSSKRSPKHLSLTKHRRLGTFHLDSKYLRFDLYAPLHEMWKEYVTKLIAGCSDLMMQSRLLTADLHGAPLEVVESKHSGFSGTKGLMIRETENTFAIITSSNNFKVVPKRGSIFMLHLDNMRVTLFGNNLSLRTAESNSKPKKLKPTIELY